MKDGRKSEHPEKTPDDELQKMCDQYAVGITHFPHGDIEREWDHLLWVESYTTYPCISAPFRLP